MDRRPRADRRAAAAGAVAAATLVAALVGSPSGHAQPAAAPGEADLARAKDLYRTAEAELADEHYDDAVRDYGASYELSKDPALLFKIGRAHERAGRCDVALGFYTRYLREGQPAEPFVETTNERIAACGGKPEKPGSSSAGGPSGSGSADVGSASNAGSAGASAGSAGASAGSTGGGRAGAADSAGSASAGSAGSGSGETALPRLSNQRKAAWIVTGTSLALVTLGGVLAYAASSSENDIKDLYAGFGNIPPSFDSATRKSYNDLVDQGRRYQHLSWAAFGAAGAAAVGAALLFWLDDSPEAPRIAPAVSPHSAGVSIRF